jgi:hypothetical protein
VDHEHKTVRELRKVVLLSTKTEHPDAAVLARFVAKYINIINRSNLLPFCNFDPLPVENINRHRFQRRWDQYWKQ